MGPVFASKMIVNCLVFWIFSSFFHIVEIFYRVEIEDFPLTELNFSVFNAFTTSSDVFLFVVNLNKK